MNHQARLQMLFLWPNAKQTIGHLTIRITAASEQELTLIIEAIDAVDGGTLMVPPEQEEVFWIFDLVGEQQADGLQRLLPSIHIIPQEKIVGLRREATILE